MREKSMGRRLRPVFVPPQPRKDYRAFGLEELWAPAKDALRSADSLHVIGYNFPDNDTDARELMDIASSRLGGTDRVTLVDKRPDVWPGFAKRFPRARVHRETFGQYVAALGRS